MSDQAPPKIEFPCADYPVKILGTASEVFEVEVLEIVERHAGGFDRSKVRIQASREGRFHSITVFIEATGVLQLENLHRDLRAHGDVKMVL